MGRPPRRWRHPVTLAQRAEIARLRFLLVIELAVMEARHPGTLAQLDKLGKGGRP